MSRNDALRKTSNEFKYVNRYYGLGLIKNCRVVQVSTGRSGQVARGDGQYVHIRWDGANKTEGPYHPTDDLQYPVNGK